MSQIHQDVYQLQEEVRELRERLEAHETATGKMWNRVLYKLRIFRAEIIRLSNGESGERWHVGPEYVRGSRLRIPGMPRLLKEFLAVDLTQDGKPKYRQTVSIDPMADKDILDGARRGIPAKL